MIWVAIGTSKKERRWGPGGGCWAQQRRLPRRALHRCSKQYSLVLHSAPRTSWLFPRGAAYHSAPPGEAGSLTRLESQKEIPQGGSSPESLKTARAVHFLTPGHSLSQATAPVPMMVLHPNREMPSGLEELDTQPLHLSQSGETNQHSRTRNRTGGVSGN